MFENGKMESLYIAGNEDRFPVKDFSQLKKRVLRNDILTFIMFIFQIIFAVIYFCNIQIFPNQTGSAATPQMQQLHTKFNEKCKYLEEELAVYKELVERLNQTMEKDSDELDKTYMDMYQTVENVEQNFTNQLLSLTKQLEKKQAETRRNLTQLKENTETLWKESKNKSQIQIEKLQERFVENKKALDSAKENLDDLQNGFHNHGQRITLLNSSIDEIQVIKEGMDALQDSLWKNLSLIENKLENFMIEKASQSELGAITNKLEDLRDEVSGNFSESKNKSRIQIEKLQERFVENKEALDSAKENLDDLQNGFHNHGQRITLLNSSIDEIQVMKEGMNALQDSLLKNFSLIENKLENLTIEKASQSELGAITNKLEDLRDEVSGNFSHHIRQSLGDTEAFLLKTKELQENCENLINNASVKFEEIQGRIENETGKFQMNQITVSNNFSNLIQLLQKQTDNLEIRIADEIRSNESINAIEYRIGEFEKQATKNFSDLTLELHDKVANVSEKLTELETNGNQTISRFNENFDGAINTIQEVQAQANESISDLATKLENLQIQLRNLQNKIDDNITLTIDEIFQEFENISNSFGLYQRKADMNFSSVFFNLTQNEERMNSLENKWDDTFSHEDSQHYNEQEEE